jgi:Zn-dependent peptidase ImmA (M78 family)/DNA-binding XRE family transcriptional regulator
MPGPSLKGIVNPDLLVWARKASSLDNESAAKKIGVSSEKLDAWETGQTSPTITQLRKLADVYRRAVSFFFLDKRPSAAKRPVDFRKLDLSAFEIMTPELSNAIRAAQAKREAALDIFKEIEEQPAQFDLTLTADATPENAAKLLSERLGIAFSARSKWSDHYEVLRAWRTAAEAMGVMVMQVSGISLDEMRGCSLAMFPLPIVLLNSSDKPPGRVFTLLHELTHLARRESALCDIAENRERTQEAQAIEVYCNHVAGAVLVPMERLLADSEVASAKPTSHWKNEKLDSLRRYYWASREVILRRLLTANKTSQSFYKQKRDEFIQDYARLRETPSTNFVPFYRKVLLGNGRLLTGLVVSAYDSQVITGSALSRILGTKLDHLPKIVAELRSTDAPEVLSRY